MELREALDGLGGLITGFEVKDLRAAGMQLLVHRRDFGDGGDTAGSGEILEVHPGTETALAGVERGRDAALALQESFYSPDPCGMFSPGV